jgi:hypothetical protein
MGKRLFIFNLIEIVPFRQTGTRNHVMLKLFKGIIPEEDTMPIGVGVKPAAIPFAKRNLCFDNPSPPQSQSKTCRLWHHYTSEQVRTMIKHSRAIVVRLSRALLASLASALTPCLSDKLDDHIGVSCSVVLRKYLPESKHDFPGLLAVH